MFEHFIYTDDGWLQEPAGQPDDEQIRRGCLLSFLSWVLLILMLAALAALSSCTTTRYVPIETVRTDTVQITRHQRDSIFLHDSIHVSEKQRGDTVWMEVERWHTECIEKATHDTTYIATHDTVPQPYPVPEYIEKKLSWWQQTRMHLGEALLAALLIAAAVWIVKKRAWWLSLLRKIL